MKVRKGPVRPDAGWRPPVTPYDALTQLPTATPCAPIAATTPSTSLTSCSNRPVRPANNPSPTMSAVLQQQTVVVTAPTRAADGADLLPGFRGLFGGARGGGKTESSIGDWLEHSSTYGEAAIGIFVRRKLVQLAEVIARTKQIFPKLGAKYHEQSKTWTMPNGARLKFAYLEKDSDAEEYQGHNYTRVYVEEVTNFPSPSPINLLLSHSAQYCWRACGHASYRQPWWSWT